jgi:hypothetical protein
MEFLHFGMKVDDIQASTALLARLAELGVLATPPS